MCRISSHHVLIIIRSHEIGTDKTRCISFIINTALMAMWFLSNDVLYFSGKMECVTGNDKSDR